MLGITKPTAYTSRKNCNREYFRPGIKRRLKMRTVILTVFFVLVSTLLHADGKSEKEAQVRKLLARLHREPFHAELICDKIATLGKEVLPELELASKEDDLSVRQAAKRSAAAIAWRVSPRSFYIVGGGFSDIIRLSHIPPTDALKKKIKQLEAEGDLDNLIDIVRTGHPQASLLALRSIESMGKESKAVKILLGSLQPLDWFYAGALLARSPKEVLATVIEKLGSRKDNDRLGAACVLVVSPCAQAVASLIKATEDKSSLVRLKSVQALGAAGDKKALDTLIKRLKEETDYTVRAEIAWALGLIQGSEKAAEVLTRALKDKKSNVVNRAIESLAVIGGKPALKALSTFAGNSQNDALTRNRAIRAIGQIGGENALDCLKPFFKKDDDNYSMVPAVIGSLGKAALPYIKEILESTGESELKTFRKCRLSLSAMGVEAIPLLLDLLDSKKNILRLTGRTLLQALTKGKRDFEYDRAKWEEYFKENPPK
jgi:HEAT repeat protein